jgi:SAM-dependent methyltransferase
MTAIAEAFQTIYREHSWRGRSKSGPGSDPRSTAQYRRFLARFLKKNAVRSVVDLGCGDWASSQLIDWSGVDYLGLDVVPTVIEENQRKFGRPGVRFRQCNVVEEDPPRADLAICKEMLQHLPLDSIASVLAKLPNYRMALLINDSHGEFIDNWRNYWVGGCPFIGTNIDIPAGGYRPLKLLEPPFQLDARVVLRYRCQFGEHRWYKEVLLWTNPERPN